MNDNDNIFYALMFFPCAAAVIIFFMKYLSAVLQARVRRTQDEAYRELASGVAAAQAQTTAALESFSITLAKIQQQLATVEKILAEID